MARILVIEDHPSNMLLLLDVLTAAGHEVIPASDAERGLELARSARPHLVVMDLRLPGIDGLTATRRLKACPETAHIPVLAATAHAFPGDEVRIRAAGCDGYLTKPLRYRELLSLVSELLG